ncbi:MAG: PKD domain-containing protein [Saprospiraceae bacterium]|nr:PKD domain-containing protein [Saprospiraceae bacterium]
MGSFKLSFLLLILFFLPNVFYGQCLILGPDMPCNDGVTYYQLNYFSGNGDTVVSTDWSIKDPFGDKLSSNKDTVIYHWKQAGKTTLIAKFITSNGDTVTCNLVITIKENKIFDIYSDNSGTCKSGEGFNFCKGDSTNFYTENDSTLQYIWIFNGDTLPSNSYQSGIIQFPNEGTYNLRMIAWNPITGCVSTFTKNVNIFSPPDPIITVFDTLTDSITICRDQPLTFKNGTVPSDGNIYLWRIINSNNDSTEFSSPNDFKYIFKDSGRYIIRLIAQNCLGCKAFIDFIVNVNSLRTATIDCPSVVCQDDQKQVMYTAKDTCSTYTWSVIGSNKDSAVGNKLWVVWDSFPPNGKGYVKLITSGCTEGVCDGETIVEIPILPTVGQIDGEKVLCSFSGTNSYKVPLWAGASYKWSIIPDNDTSHIKISKGENGHEVFIKRTNYTGSFRIKVNVKNPLADCYFEKEDTIRTHLITLNRDTVCFGSAATFEFDPHGESIDSAIWTYQGNTRRIYNSNQVTYDSSFAQKRGLQDLIVKVKFTNGDICSASTKIFINKVSSDTISGPQIICLDSIYTYYVQAPGIVEWMITNGVKQDSMNKKITIKWTVSGKNNKILKARYKDKECYSEWRTIYVSDIDSVGQIVSGYQFPCEDSEELYLVTSHASSDYFKWIIDSTLGQIINQDSDSARIRWKKLAFDHDTTTIITYKDSLCGNMYTFNYPVTIIKRSKGIISNSLACAGKDIVFSVNVKANSYIWDFGDGSFDTTSNINITHKYSDKGFYRVNVRWIDAMGCVIGFSATKEIEVESTLEPFIKAFNNSNDEFIDCLTTDTVEIRFQANEYNIPDVKYRWFIDTIEQTNDTASTLVRTHPTDFDFTKVFVKLFVEGPICSDTAYLRLDTCVSPVGCMPYDTVRITSIIDSTCYIRNANGAFLPFFNLFLPEPVNITPGYPTPRYLYRRGEWIFEDIRTVRKNVINQVDLINQSHEYQKAGYWLVRLIGNARDNIDTTQLCQDSDARIDTILMVSDFIYTFTCDTDGYNIKLKSYVTFLSGFDPTQYKYSIDDADYFSSTGDIEVHINNGTSLVCLEATDGMSNSCSICKSISTPAELTPPEIKMQDTVCASTPLTFDIIDADFTADITDYLWVFGDGDSSRIRRPSHLYKLSDTTIQIELYVTNKWGCMSMSSFSVYIVPNTLKGNVTIDTLLCDSHRQLQFNQTAGRTPLNYLWSTADTTSGIIVNLSDKYTIKVTDKYGCELIVRSDVLLGESFTSQLLGIDSVCSNDSDPGFTFYGSDDLYDCYVTSHEVPSGTIDTISYKGIDVHTFNFNITGKSGFHEIIVRAYIAGTSTLCDSLIHRIKINPIDTIEIKDSLLSCKPYLYIISESNNKNIEWYKIDKQDTFKLDTGSQISVYSGGKYIGLYKNSHNCVSFATADVDDQIDLSPFISGCYERCDTLLDKGIVFIPVLDDPTIYNWWKYKHLDSNSIIKQGTNSRVDSFLLQKKHQGKIYLVVESKNGCVDSSDLLCLLVDHCFNPINCDSVSIDSSGFSITQEHFNCETQIGEYEINGAFKINNTEFGLCDSASILITNIPWSTPPTISVSGHRITISNGRFKIHEDSCTSPLNIEVNLCLDSLECTKNISQSFTCYDEPCNICDTLTTTCPHLGFYKDHFDCDDSTGYYQVFGTIVLGGVEGFELCTPDPFIIENMEWVEQPTITYSGNTITISGGLIKMKEDSCNGSVNIKVRLCRDGIECIKSLPEADFECYNNTCGIDRVITYIRSNGTRKIDVIGYVDNLVNCGDDHLWVRVRVYDSTCTTLIDQDYVSKTGFNKFRALLDVPDTSAAECYCLKVCLSSGSTQCEQQCAIPFCTGSNQYLSSGGNGNINISTACTAHTTTGNIYSYSTSFDGNAYDIYQDSLVYEAETMSHSCSEGTCSGSFKIDTLATTVDMTLFFNNPDFPISTIAIDTTVSLANCNGGGGGHNLEGKDTGINKSKSGEQSLITTTDAGKASSLSLIPNPTNSSTTIYYQVPDKEEGWEINILDFAGKSFEKKLCCDLKGNFKFDCSDRASGMYFVILKKNGKITASKKLLIIK